MKSEPNVYSIDNLAEDKKTWWEGVRNYQARNFMKEMNLGDEVLFYHSNAEPSAVVGLATVSHLAVPDMAQFDTKNEYFEPKATKEKPIWYYVEVKYKSKFKRQLSLPEIKETKELKNMTLIKRGRLSVQPVTEKEFKFILNRIGN